MCVLGESLFSLSLPVTVVSLPDKVDTGLGVFHSSSVPAQSPVERVSSLHHPFSLSLSSLVKAASQVRFPRFRGTSYLALPTVKDAERSMQVNIHFRPEKNEGLILYSGEKSTLEGDFVALLLNGGFIEFR